MKKNLALLLPIVVTLLATGGHTYGQKKMHDINYMKNLVKNNSKYVKAIAEIDAECDGAADFYISQETATKMMDKFKSAFCYQDANLPIHALNQYEWIDACVINALAKLLEPQSALDGFRVYFGAEDASASSFPRQQFKNKASIIIVPTYLYFDPRNPNEKIHKNFWGKQLAPSCIPEFAHFDLDAQSAKHKHQNFSTYRNKFENLSRSVWFSRCLVAHIKEYMTNHSSDGLKIYFGAYDIANTAPGQKYAVQSTVILVPTHKKDGLDKQDDWEVYKSQEYKNFKDNNFQAFNHGELCPNTCPPPNDEFQ